MSRTDLRRVDLNLLVLFEALMEERHVGRAAARLNMSQSGASYALGRLRELIGDTLFLPHPKGVHPTPRALSLAPAVESILALARQALTHEPRFAPSSAERSFTVGATDYVSFVLLPQLVTRLRQEAPGVDLRVRPVDRDTLLTDLDQGRLDAAVGLLSDPPERIASVPLFEEHLVCVARQGHALFAEDLTPRRLAQAPHLLVSLRGDATGPGDEALALLGLKRRVMVTIPHFLAAPFLLQDSDLVALLASRVVGRFAGMVGLETRPVPLDIPPWTISLLSRKDRQSDPALAWLHGLLRDVAQERAC